MPSPLDNLVAGGSLHREAPDGAEYEALVRSGRIRLGDAESKSNALESRFDLAYNAAHALCLAALRRQGYRPANKRYVGACYCGSVRRKRSSRARTSATFGWRSASARSQSRTNDV